MNQPPYQNQPAGTTPPPPPGAGYTYYPEQNSQEYAQEYAQQRQAYMPPPTPGYMPPPAQPVYPGVVYAPTVPDPGKGLAITGFVLGIVGVCMVCLAFSPFFWIPLIVATLGLIFSAMGRKSRTARGLAIAGLVVSIIAVVISAVGFLAYLGFIASLPHYY